MATRPILCLDFDGVLHLNGHAGQGDDHVAGPPVAGAADFLRAATMEHGFRIAVVSSRSKSAAGRRAMRAYVEALLTAAHGDTIARAVMEHVDFPEHKPAAQVTLDDRAITFTGTFPDPAALKAFAPWHKQG